MQKIQNAALFLKQEKVKKYIDFFNGCDEEFIKQSIPNCKAEEFIFNNAPLLDCPDKLMEMIYYFRWWTLRKHIKETEDGFVFSEFLPKVPWSKKHNTIVCASGFHIAESRWLHNSKYAEDYLRFWYSAGAEGRNDYTSWLPFAALQMAEVTGNDSVAKELLSEFVADYRLKESGFKVYGNNEIYKDSNGLFYSYDFFDGGELSIGGNGFRPYFNSAMYASATAIAKIAKIVGNGDIELEFEAKAADLKNSINSLLWDEERGFYEVLKPSRKFKEVRELYGFAPWMFMAAEEGRSEGFSQLFDLDGFWSPCGPTFAEQRNPEFALNYSGHECQWNGPVWPMSTSVTLSAMENLLNCYADCKISKKAFAEILRVYAASQIIVKDNGTLTPWIDENMNPYTGDWISRTRLSTWKNGTWCDYKGGYERGKDYNHSMFCNFIISGLVGVRPSFSDELVINPLLPENWWDWFCLDNLKYHGKDICIMWDKNGEHYKQQKGLSVYVDGKLTACADELKKITVGL